MKKTNLPPRLLNVSPTFSELSSDFASPPISSKRNAQSTAQSSPFFKRPRSTPRPQSSLPLSPSNVGTANSPVTTGEPRQNSSGKIQSASFFQSSPANSTHSQSWSESASPGGNLIERFAGMHLLAAAASVVSKEPIVSCPNLRRAIARYRYGSPLPRPKTEQCEQVGLSISDMSDQSDNEQNCPKTRRKSLDGLELIMDDKLLYCVNPLYHSDNEVS
jgi:hypothetical protein